MKGNAEILRASTKQGRKERKRRREGNDASRAEREFSFHPNGLSATSLLLESEVQLFVI